MSRASRLAAADTCFDRPRDETTGKFRKRAELARNGARVPGALGFVLDGPVQVCGIEWHPSDGEPWGSPIGVALAAEMADSE